MKKYISILFTVMFVTVLMAFVPKTTNDPWPVPDKYKNMANPVKSDATSIAKGKELFSQVMDQKRLNSIPNAVILQNHQPNLKLMVPYFIKHPKDVRTCHHSKRKLLIRMTFGQW
jgi:hypothetical protein